MSRRIAYLFAVAACATLAAPAGADPECFDGVCRMMPQVIEPPQPVAQAVEEVAPAAPEPQGVVKQDMPAEMLRAHPAPETIRPQMRVDDLPRPALPQRPVDTAHQKPALHPVKPKPARAVVRHAPPPAVAVEEPAEPVEVVSRRYAPEPRVYAAHPAVPHAGIVVVAPGAQYGEDGIAVANAPQDQSWRLCQGSARSRCIQYNYQPYGAYGYRPLGTYRAYRQAPSYVYVPDAKVITVD